MHSTNMFELSEAALFHTAAHPDHSCLLHNTLHRTNADPRGLAAAAVPKPSLSFNSLPDTDQQDHALLDSLIASNSTAAAAASAADSSRGESLLDAVLVCDVRALNVDNEMKKRFGAGAAAAAANAPGGQGKFNQLNFRIQIRTYHCVVFSDQSTVQL
jgi:hypothetical protein